MASLTTLRSVHLLQEAQRLPVAWKSKLIGKAAGANVKVLAMDGSAYPNEVHDYAEALLVLEGHLNLVVDDMTVRVSAGELFMVPAGQTHAVAAGSQGALLIIDA